MSPLLYPLACDDADRYADLAMNDPFNYTPHPLCLAAVGQLMPAIDDLMRGEREGKMFGVLVVKSDEAAHGFGFLAAYSGQIRGRSDWPGFVPAVFDYLQPDGYFKQHEAEISAMNREIARREQEPERVNATEALAQAKKDASAQLGGWQRQMFDARERRRALRAEGNVTAEQEEEMIRESQFMKAEYRRMKKQVNEQIEGLKEQVEAFDGPIRELKAERRRRSDELQQWLFSHFEMLNANGERRNLVDIFRQTSLGRPPSGAGECCEPKLLQYAYAHGLRPVQMAMFWVGKSPKVEIRHDGRFYPACRGKCLPILRWMLAPAHAEGGEVGMTPPSFFSTHLREAVEGAAAELPVIYEDDVMLIVNKPAGLLTVPGISEYYSVWSIIRSRYPDYDSPFTVHRLDQPTSGLLIIAKTRQVHRELQRQFMDREVQKRYVALLERSSFPNSLKVIDLPLMADPLNRPYQIVDREHGKQALTRVELLGDTDGHARVALYPKTGRTHQLRVHCAHAEGLNNPILGDMLYGRLQSRRLFLHAESISFRHPLTGERVSFSAPPDF